MTKFTDGWDDETMKRRVDCPNPKCDYFFWTDVHPLSATIWQCPKCGQVH